MFKNVRLFQKIYFVFVCLVPLNINFSTAFAQGKSSKYSECIKDFGTMNNAAVHKCASEVSEFLKIEIEHKLRQIINKIIEKGNFEKKNDLNEFLQSDYHWKTHMELQCKFQTKYIGTPMLHYCPMTKLEKRLEELEIILDGVSN